MGAREQQAILGAYAQSAAELRGSMLRTLIAVWFGLRSWRDADQQRFVRQAITQVAGAQRQMQSLTLAYLSALIGDMTGQQPARVLPPPRTMEQLRPADPTVVYARPFRTLYASLGEGREFPDAMQDAVRRLVHIAATDLQLAKTYTARDAMAGDGRIVGYQRVLVGSQSCGLCVVASTQRYHKGELLPIHPGCDCAVAPIIGDQDPGQIINETRLEDTHDAILQTFGVSNRDARNPLDYRDVLVTHEHGEIGPILARRGDRFTGPNDIGGRSGGQADT